jgi:uncharacterized protein YcbX
MSECRVVGLYNFPVKGAAGTTNDRLEVDPAIGVRGDRRYALKRSADTPDRWAPKAAFFVGMNRALMVSQTPSIVADAAGERLDPQWVEYVAAQLGVERIEVLDSHGAFSLADRPRQYVSIVNLASVRALEEFVGAAIDPARFRMNVWLDGLEPFAELDWVVGHPGVREMEIGALRLRVDEACVRCKAIEANPQTGVYDLELQQALAELMRSRSYGGAPHNGSLAVMGVLARPYAAGTIKQGDAVHCD